MYRHHPQNNQKGFIPDNLADSKKGDDYIIIPLLVNDVPIGLIWKLCNIVGKLGLDIIKLPLDSYEQ